MANKEISELAAAGTLTGAELLHLVQSGNSRQSTVKKLLQLLQGIDVISPSQITADQNDYAPTGLVDAGVLRLSTDAERAITGLTAGSAVDPRKLIINTGLFSLTLQSEDAASSAANRFALDGPDELYVRPGGTCQLFYDVTSARWRPVTWSRSNTQFAHGTITGSPGMLGEPTDGEFQTLTNNGAFTWFAPDEEGIFVVLVTNGASAGAITASGFDDEQTADFTTTNAEKFEVIISNFGTQQSMTVRALQ